MASFWKTSNMAKKVLMYWYRGMSYRYHGNTFCTCCQTRRTQTCRQTNANLKRTEKDFTRTKADELHCTYRNAWLKISICTFIVKNLWEKTAGDKISLVKGKVILVMTGHASKPKRIWSYFTHICKNIRNQHVRNLWPHKWWRDFVNKMIHSRFMILLCLLFCFIFLLRKAVVQRSNNFSLLITKLASANTLFQPNLTLWKQKETKQKNLSPQNVHKFKHTMQECNQPGTQLKNHKSRSRIKHKTHT